MKREVWIQPLATRDIDETGSYLRATSVSSAARFVDAIDETMDWLETMAEFGQRYDFADGSESGLRFCRLRKFDSYLAFYRIVQANVFVYRVLHGSRNLAVILGDVKE